MDLGVLRWSLYLYQHGLPWAFYCDQANDRIIATERFPNKSCWSTLHIDLTVRTLGQKAQATWNPSLILDDEGEKKGRTYGLCHDITGYLSTSKPWS